MYFLRFLFVLTRLFLRTIFLVSSSEKKAKKFLRELEIKLDGKFQEDAIKKIIRYHHIYYLHIFHIFNKLQGRRTSNEESLKLLNFTILQVIFDDFFDNKSYSFEQINQMTFQPSTYKPKVFEERVFLNVGLFLLNEVRNKDEYLEICKRMVDIQFASLEQFDKAIELEKLKYITFEKGGCSILLSSYLLDNDIIESEKKYWFILGEILQLNDDIFDIFDDLRDGIQTIPLCAINFREIEDIYAQKMEEMKTQVKNLSYSKSSLRNFNIHVMNLVAFGFVGIRNLKDSYLKFGFQVNLKSLPRKYLITDFEKIRNIRRLLTINYELGKMHEERSKNF